MRFRHDDGPRSTPPRTLTFLTYLMASFAALFVLTCSGDQDPASDAREPGAALPAVAPSSTGQAPQAGARIDFSEVARRVHLRFRPDGEGWRGGPSSYSARVGAEGMRFAPRVSAKNGQPPTQGAELVLGPPALARGDAGGAATQAPIVDRGKGLAIDRGLAEEQLENTEQGVEQSFRFASRPAGKGDVTVRVPVS